MQGQRPSTTQLFMKSLELIKLRLGVAIRIIRGNKHTPPGEAVHAEGASRVGPGGGGPPGGNPGAVFFYHAQGLFVILH
eukprot:15478380-Alexandrium_andersonii.AAC.1